MYEYKGNMIYFGAMLFDVQAQILCNFFDSRFMMFSQVLMKELIRMLTHINKIFNCWVSFKMPLMYFIIGEMELRT